MKLTSKIVGYFDVACWIRSVTREIFFAVPHHFSIPLTCGFLFSRHARHLAFKGLKWW